MTRARLGSSPYRLGRESGPPVAQPEHARRVATLTIVGWSLLRGLLCLFHGVDGEGLLALVLVAVLVPSVLTD